MIRQKTLGLVLTATSFAFIAAMTMVPYPEQVEQVHAVPFSCLVCGEFGGEDVILNVLLFVPFGIGLRLTGLARWKTFGIAVLTTAAVESLQHTVIMGRHASLSDLLTNSTGGGLGIVFADHWRGLILPRQAGARRLAWFGMAIWLGIQTLSASLISISLPAATYFGLWAPQLPEFDQFHGKVLSATLNGDSVPATRLTNSRNVRSQLQSDSFALEVTAMGDTSESWLAPMVSVLDDQKHEILFLGQLGRDLVFRVRMRTADFKFHTPAVRLTEVLSTIPGAQLHIRAGMDRGRLFLQLMRDEQEYRRDLALSPSWGWSFVFPYELAFGSEVYLLTALWIAGPLLPVPYWVRRGTMTRSDRWRGCALLASLLGLGLGAIPLAMGLPAVHWSEWLAGAVGMVAGWSLGAVSGDRRPAAPFL